MVEVTEFLRRLASNIPDHKKLNQIQVLFESNNQMILIEDVIRDTIYYRRANTRSILRWTPTSMEEVRYYVTRVDELRINKRKGYNSRLVGLRGRVRVQVRKVNL